MKLIAHQGDHNQCSFRIVSKEPLIALKNIHPPPRPSPLLETIRVSDLTIRVTLLYLIFSQLSPENYLFLHFTELGMKVKESKLAAELAFEPRQSYSRAFPPLSTTVTLRQNC